MCTNTEGSFQCEAAKGFRSDAFSISGEYVDIDECNEGTHLCDINAHCFNVPGKSSKSNISVPKPIGSTDFQKNSL